MEKTVDMRQIHRRFHECLVNLCQRPDLEELGCCFREYPKLFDNAYDAGVVRSMHRYDAYPDGRFTGCCESIAVLTGLSTSKVKHIMGRVIDEVGERCDDPTEA